VSSRTFNVRYGTFAQNFILSEPFSKPYDSMFLRANRNKKRFLIYCTAAPSECDAALAAFGVNKTTFAYSSKLRKDMEANRKDPTRYTPEEAALAVTGHGNNKLTIYFK